MPHCSTSCSICLYLQREHLHNIKSTKSHSMCISIPCAMLRSVSVPNTIARSVVVCCWANRHARWHRWSPQTEYLANNSTDGVLVTRSSSPIHWYVADACQYLSFRSSAWCHRLHYTNPKLRCRWHSIADYCRPIEWTATFRLLSFHAQHESHWSSRDVWHHRDARHFESCVDCEPEFSRTRTRVVFRCCCCWTFWGWTELRSGWKSIFFISWMGANHFFDDIQVELEPIKAVDSECSTLRGTNRLNNIKII